MNPATVRGPRSTLVGNSGRVTRDSYATPAGWPPSDQCTSRRRSDRSVAGVGHNGVSTESYVEHHSDAIRCDNGFRECLATGKHPEMASLLFDFLIEDSYFKPDLIQEHFAGIRHTCLLSTERGSNSY